MIPVSVRLPYTLELPPGAPPAQGWPLLVALHGMGMRPEAFAKRVRPALPTGTALALPQAPLPYEHTGRDGTRSIRRAWYVYDGDSPEFRRRILQAAGWVRDLKTALCAGRPVDPARTALLGFSQGGYLAGVAGVRFAADWAGLAVCAARCKTEMLSEWLPAMQGRRVLLCHAVEDTGVPPEAVERARPELEAAGADVTSAGVPGGHAFSPAMAAVVRRWLAEAWSR